MLRNLISNSFRHKTLIIRSLSQQTIAQSKEKWDLYAGVLLERLPIVSKTLTPFEKEFQELLWQIEYEKSLKNDFELRHERDLIQAERLKRGEIEVDLDDSTAKQTAQDLKDAYTEEFKKFKFAPRITEDDQKNNVKSTNRKLEDTLYLLVEQKLGNKSHFILPQGVRQDGETMRQTAERVLREKCGDEIRAIFYGNAPCGFFKYKYPKEARHESVGAKIFFFRAVFKDGNVNEKLSKKYGWLDKKSLLNELKGNYSERVQQFLF